MRDDPAHPERRAQQSRGLGDRAGGDEPADVRRGHDLAVDLDELHDPRRERVLRGQQRRVALRAVAEAEVLADRDLDRAEPLDELVVDELLRGLRHALAVERDHDQLVDAERRDQVGLLLERGQQFGRGRGETTVRGCGSKVSTASAPAMTSR